MACSTGNLWPRSSRSRRIAGAIGPERVVRSGRPCAIFSSSSRFSSPLLRVFCVRFLSWFLGSWLSDAVQQATTPHALSRGPAAQCIDTTTHGQRLHRLTYDMRPPPPLMTIGIFGTTQLVFCHYARICIILSHSLHPTTFIVSHLHTTLIVAYLLPRSLSLCFSFATQ